MGVVGREGGELRFLCVCYIDLAVFVVCGEASCWVSKAKELN